MNFADPYFSGHPAVGTPGLAWDRQLKASAPPTSVRPTKYDIVNMIYGGRS